MGTATRMLLAGAAALGLAASATSASVHHRLLTEPGFTSFCDVNRTVSCTEAYLSAYGSLAGIPVAVFGVLFFTVILAVVLLGGRRRPDAVARVPAYVFVLTLPALAFSAYLAYASFVLLQAVCLLCVTTYAAVIALAVIAGLAARPALASLPRHLGGDLKALLTSPAALAVAVAVLLGGWWMGAAFPRSSPAVAAEVTYTPATPQERASLAEWWKLQPRVDLPAEPGAKVTVVKFNDYQCPTCGLTYRLYAPVFAKYADRGVRLVVKQFPLESECNGSISGGNHFASCEASAAVLLARERGTADRMEQWLFSNLGPPMLTPAQVREAARTVGGIEDFDGQYARALDAIRAEAALGGRIGIRQTPTFFINGRTVSQVLQPQYFEALIDIELAEAR